MAQHSVQAAMIQGDNVIVIIDNKTHTVNRNTVPAACYDDIVAAVKAGDYAKIEELVDVEKSINNFGNGKITLTDGVIHYEGRQMNCALSKRVLNMIREKANVNALVAFMDNLLSNPSKRAIDELYGFLENNSLPITPDGCILAYKAVNKDYKDIHSGSFDNRIGAKPTMHRNMVDDNCNRTCSTGLHFASLDYARGFRTHDGHLMIVKVNPRDVVSIPIDYNHQKARCCAYEVVGEHDVRAAEAGKEAFHTTVVDVGNTAG